MNSIDRLIKQAFDLAAGESDGFWKSELAKNDDQTTSSQKSLHIRAVVDRLFPNANDIIKLLIISKYLCAQAIIVGMRTQSLAQTHEDRSRREQALIDRELSFMDASTLLRGWYGFTRKEREILARLTKIDFGSD